MTFGVIEKEKPLLAGMISRACESAGHECLIFENLTELTRVLHSIRIDTIVLDIERPDLNGLDWLETMLPSWPDLPSRTLLLTNSVLSFDEEARIETLGARVAATPVSFVDVQRVVMKRLRTAPEGPVACGVDTARTDSSVMPGTRPLP